MRMARLDALCASPDLRNRRVDCALLVGSPVPRILEYAEQHGFDLIVMGTHGRGALVDTMMGSTATRVLRRSKIPVLAVRLPEED